MFRSHKAYKGQGPYWSLGVSDCSKVFGCSWRVWTLRVQASALALGLLASVRQCGAQQPGCGLGTPLENPRVSVWLGDQSSPDPIAPNAASCRGQSSGAPLCAGQGVAF